MGQFEAAKEALLMALDIVEQREDTVFEVAVTYANLANTNLRLGLEEEAKDCFDRAIALFEAHNIKDTHYCAALSALATFHYQKGDYQEAEKYFLKHHKDGLSVPHSTLPSTSPANAKYSLDALAEAWAVIKEYL